MDIVEIRNLKKYFRDGPQVVKALDGIDLSIEKGKFTVIAGASGSGKTTLLNTIAGLYEPDEGTVIVDGLDLSKMGEEQLTVFRRRRIGFVFQGYNLIPELTIKENIVFPLGPASPHSESAAPDAPPAYCRSSFGKESHKSKPAVWQVPDHWYGHEP